MRDWPNRYLKSRVREVRLSKRGFQPMTSRSCDCDSVVLRTEDGLLLLTHLGNAFLFVSASEYNLIVTVSVYDLFEDEDMELPEKEAELVILKREETRSFDL